MVSPLDHLDALECFVQFAFKPDRVLMGVPMMLVKILVLLCLRSRSQIAADPIICEVRARTPFVRSPLVVFELSCGHFELISD